MIGLRDVTNDPIVPADCADLLDKPIVAHLATVRPDGTPQSNVMWFGWDGSRIRMSFTTKRQKLRNVQREPQVALTLVDPESPYRFLEVRGSVESVEPDEAVRFYKSLQERYSMPLPIKDGDERIIVTIRPHTYLTMAGRAPQPSEN
jgi:PPOX class probable F420-dependent enzyme